MARSFSKEERTYLKEEMYRVGKACLMKYGVSRTKIEDITNEVGISKGAFYSFFPSKEEFFFDMLEMVHDKIFQQMREQLKAVGSLEEKIKKIFYEYWLTEETMMFMAQGNELNSMIKKLPPQRIAKHLQKDSETAENFLKMIGCDTKRVNPEVLENLFKTIILLNVNTIMMEESAMAETNELLIETVINYIKGVQ